MKLRSIFLIVAFIIHVHALETGNLSIEQELTKKSETINKLPSLIDFGSHSCIACKKMTPVLDGLKKEFKDIFDVEFIDVSLTKNLVTAYSYKIQRIPTQIFLDSDRKELWRHEGYLSRDEILAKWKELKYTFKSPVEEKQL
jgi:thioredoxin 1